MKRGRVPKCKILIERFPALLTTACAVDRLFKAAIEDPPALKQLVGSHCQRETVVRTCILMQQHRLTLPAAAHLRHQQRNCQPPPTSQLQKNFVRGGQTGAIETTVALRSVGPILSRTSGSGTMELFRYRLIFDCCVCVGHTPNLGQYLAQHHAQDAARGLNLSWGTITYYASMLRISLCRLCSTLIADALASRE